MTDVPHRAADAASEGSRMGRFIRVANSQSVQDDSLLGRAIVRAKQGDMDALHFLYVRYADDVYGFVNSIVRDTHAAEDITQNIFGKLMKAICKYEPREVPFSAWILRVAQNAALDHLKRRRQVPFAQMQLSDSGRDQLGWDRRRCLTAALAGLTDVQREVLVLHHVGDLSLREIADRMGKSEGAVTQLHHRGRAALRVSLAELESAPRTRRPAAAD
jgi:RNA polymerase sigma-70 factor, ECF subfamily